MKTKLEGYRFKDQYGHLLEKCQDYLDIVDVIKKAKEFIKAMDVDGGNLGEYYFETKKEFEQAIAKVVIEKDDKDEDTYHKITLKIDENKPIWYYRCLCMKCKNLQYRIMKDVPVGGLHEMWCGLFGYALNGTVETCGHFKKR